MAGTHFSNPVGFDWWEGADVSEEMSNEASDGTEVLEEAEIRNYSTARDVTKMLGVALQNERFREIFGTYERELPSVGLVARKTFPAPGTGANAVYSGIKGGKTGFTFAAGRCFASVAEVEGTEYILVTLGAEGANHLEDARKVYQAVEAEYEPVRLIKEGGFAGAGTGRGQPGESAGVPGGG